MSAVKRSVQIQEIRKTWQDIFWAIADGDVTKYNEIKKMDVFEFYPFFDKWKERQDALRAQANKK